MIQERGIRGQRGKAPRNRFFILFHLTGQIRFKRVGKSFLKMDFLGGHGESQFYKEWGGDGRLHWTLAPELREMMFLLLLPCCDAQR